MAKLGREVWAPPVFEGGFPGTRLSGRDLSRRFDGRRRCRACRFESGEETASCAEERYARRGV
eukprot:1629948-Pleurochrysis_carterae.AAC.2